MIPNPDENTWGIGIGIAVVVIIILSEGDILDGLDFGGEGKKKKAKNKM